MWERARRVSFSPSEVTHCRRLELRPTGPGRCLSLGSVSPQEAPRRPAAREAARVPPHSEKPCMRARRPGGGPPGGAPPSPSTPRVAPERAGATRTARPSHRAAVQFAEASQEPPEHPEQSGEPKQQEPAEAPDRSAERPGAPARRQDASGAWSRRGCPPAAPRSAP